MGWSNFSSFFILIGRPIYRTGMLLFLVLKIVGIVVVWLFQKTVRVISGSFETAGKEKTRIKRELAGGFVGFVDNLFNKIKALAVRKIGLPVFGLPRLGPIVTKRRVGITAVLFGVFLLSFIPVLFFFHTLPSPELLKTRELILTTKIYARDGKTLLYKIYKAQNRSLVNLDELPDHLIEATIAIEDKDFYKHKGLSLRGIIRAIKVNWLKQDVVEGGSTITQQLIKNALLTPERTFWRKIREVILAIEAELIYTKDEIMTMYFNEVGFGGAAYGIEEAAAMYFGKNAADLTLAESALLAGLPAAPTYYSPFGVDPERAVKRQHQVLRRMYEDGYISYEEMEAVKKEELNFARQEIEIVAPHFVMYVKERLVDEFGEKMVEQGGLTVITTLDPVIQQQAEAEIREGVAKQRHLAVGNGAGVVTKPLSGEILAMVGSVDYFDETNDGNVNVILMPRQPGSSIKPVNYAAALLSGYTPTTVLEDTPITYRFADSRPYSPVNYDGRFRGRVTLRQALGNSLNVPAVKVLASYGVDKMIDLGEAMGITTWEDRDRFGYSLTLGGGDVKMVDMAVVFGTLANGGLRVDLNPILQVTDSRGEIISRLEDEIEREGVLSSGVAFLVSNILADDGARKAVFGPNSPLVIDGHDAAVKTGTTDTKRDNWTIGYTPDYLVGVWIGNNDNSPMSPLLESGNSGAAPIWHNIISEVLAGKKNNPFEVPPDVIAVKICAQNGLLACKNCPKVVKEYFLRGTEPTRACDWRDFRRKEKEKISN